MKLISCFISEEDVVTFSKSSSGYLSSECHVLWLPNLLQAAWLHFLEYYFMVPLSCPVVTGAAGLVLVSPETLLSVEGDSSSHLTSWNYDLLPGGLPRGVLPRLWSWLAEHMSTSGWDFSIFWLWEKYHQVDLLSERQGFTQWAHGHFNNLSARHHGPLNCGRLSTVFSRNTIFESQVKATVDSLNGMFDLPIQEGQWFWLSDECHLGWARIYFPDPLGFSVQHGGLLKLLWASVFNVNAEGLL